MYIGPKNSAQKKKSNFFPLPGQISDPTIFHTTQKHNMKLYKNLVFVLTFWIHDMKVYDRNLVSILCLFFGYTTRNTQNK